MTPTDTDSYSPTIDQARHELWEGIETSREIVRQSRMLIELSECDAIAANENEERGIAN
jgi:hypothetical protein